MSTIALHSPLNSEYLENR